MTAHALSRWRDAGVRFIVCVSLWAFGFASACMVLTHRVFAACDDFHVIWIDAVACTAEVVELQVFGYVLSLVMLEDDAVGYSISMAWSSLPFGVSVGRCGSCPFPALGFCISAE